jgi:hypothetical protein
LEAATISWKIKMHVYLNLFITLCASNVPATSNPSEPKIALPLGPIQSEPRGMAVAFPWVFNKGTETARKTAQMTEDEIVRKANYVPISAEVASAAWRAEGYPLPTYRTMQTPKSLRLFGKRLRASRVIYGSVSWHTRSIWVNAGPKTISTATVDVYVMNVATGKVVYKRTKIEGRSDERSNGYKIAAAILFTPIVTAVSGGPATPQEQRAVQIALANALNKWVTPR